MRYFPLAEARKISPPEGDWVLVCKAKGHVFEKLRLCCLALSPNGVWELPLTLSPFGRIFLTVDGSDTRIVPKLIMSFKTAKEKIKYLLMLSPTVSYLDHCDVNNKNGKLL